MSVQDQIFIKKCTIDQIDTLQNIATKTFSDTFAEANDPGDFEAYLNSAFSISSLSDQLQNPDSEFYFCYFQGELAGYLKVNFGDAQTDLKEKDHMEIERIYVLGSMQGKRIGLALMNHALDRARTNSATAVWLGVWEKNPKAIAFYERNGFIVFDKHSFKMGGDLQTDLLMKVSI